MKRELKVENWLEPKLSMEKDTEPFPMKRELKDNQSNHAVDFFGDTEPFPMKRELKVFHNAAPAGEANSDTEPFPMKRELKDAARSWVNAEQPRYRTIPYEEGTERITAQTENNM